MKAVILAAGRGRRLKDTTEPANTNKCMLKFRGKHLIEYSLETARLSKVDEIIVVVGYRAEDIINQFGIQYGNIRIRYVFQEDQKGLVHAMEQTRAALDGNDFMLLLADEILMNPSPDQMIREFEQNRAFVICGVTRVKDIAEIRKTYSVIHNPETNSIYRLIEKPRNPINDIMGTGNCLFRHEIFDYLPYTPINYFRGEKELPDPIQCAIDAGKTVLLYYLASPYVNIHTPADIEMAEHILKGA